MAILKRGLAGEPVKVLQAKLGVEVDGQFGPATEAALKAYQEAHGLAVDGVAGPDSFAAMGLHELVLLRRGSRGEMVKKLQEALGVDADGVFGAGAAEAVRKFQVEHGLEADGMAGPITLAKMDVFEDMTDDIAAKATLTEAQSLAGETAEAVAGAAGGVAGMVAKALGGEQAVEPVAEAEAEQEAPKRSIWSTITGMFS